MGKPICSDCGKELDSSDFDLKKFKLHQRIYHVINPYYENSRFPIHSEMFVHFHTKKEMIRFLVENSGFDRVYAAKEFI